MKKLCTLIDLTQKEFKKTNEMNNENSSQISLELFLDMKRFDEINSLCLLEIYHELHLLGLMPVGIAILNLFQSFKQQMLDFMRCTLFFLRSKIMFSNAGGNQSESPTNKSQKKCFFFLMNIYMFLI